MKHEFKPFDRVLVRDGDDDPWRIQLYSHPYENFHACLNGVHWQCISYEGNENLLGTTDSPEPELKKGDVVLVWDYGWHSKAVRVFSHYDESNEKYATLNEVGREGERGGSLTFWDFAEKFAPAAVEDPAAT